MTKSSKIRVVTKSPGHAPIVEYVTNDLESFQNIVGGYIEHVSVFPELQLGFFCNEEGKLRKPFLEPNVYYMGDVIVGNVVAVKADEEGETVGLSELEAQAMVSFFNLFKH